MSNTDSMTDVQKRYLEGFVTGANLVRTQRGLPGFRDLFRPSTGANASTSSSDAPGLAGCSRIHADAQDRVLAKGMKLTAEESAKRAKNPFDMWDEMAVAASEGRYPKGTDVFLYKYHGLFYVAPAQDSFMCRLRFAGGEVDSHQLREVARLARDYGGGYAHVTTRANLQFREIRAENALDVVMGLTDAGINNRGAGADNIRNITASPTAGFDSEEIIDTMPLARRMNHAILHHSELYGLPRKFNIAFDGGGAVSVLEDTNDIGFVAVRLPEGVDAPPGIYFRMQLGGITGHHDFARDTGVLLKPEECVPAAIAVIRAFIEHGDRTDRRKARLKYVLDRMGFDAFLLEAEKYLGRTFTRFPLDACQQPAPPRRLTHVGVHPQKQSGRVYVGVNVPVGRLENHQLIGLANLADEFGTGILRLTVWQNLLIPNVEDARVDELQAELEKLGLDATPDFLKSGVVACTGNRGCKYAAADTKGHALQIIQSIGGRIELDQPIKIHLTGCHHSCAQHAIGDVGLLATKIEREGTDETVEGYRVFLGGGYRENAAIGCEMSSPVPADELPALIETLLTTYKDRRGHAEETFRAFVRRHEVGELEAMMAGHLEEATV